MPYNYFIKLLWLK